MSEERIKLFQEQFQSVLETRVNQWLQESEFEIIDLKYGARDDYHNCLIVYAPITGESDVEDNYDGNKLVAPDLRTPFDAVNSLFLGERLKIEAMCYNRLSEHLTNITNLNCCISNAHHQVTSWYNIELFFSYSNVGNYKENEFHIKVTGKTYLQAYELFLKQFDSKANALTKRNYESNFSNSPLLKSPIIN